MDGSKSKFDFGAFYLYGDMYFACNRAKYSAEAARALFEYETGEPVTEINLGAVRWHAGIDENGECAVGWWLYLDKIGAGPRQCPVWVLR